MKRLSVTAISATREIMFQSASIRGIIPSQKKTDSVPALSEIPPSQTAYENLTAVRLQHS